MIGCESPLEFAAKSRTVCGFFVGTLYGGADGRAQALPVSLREFPGLSHLSALPPYVRVGWQSFNGTLEANMANSPSKRAAARVALINGQPTTTSRNIADTFVRSHRNVVQRIKQLDCSPEFRSANFSAHSYIDPQNKQTYTEYNITRDGFAFLCMGFTGAKAAQWKEKYINTFNRMAEKLAAKAAPAPQAAVISPSAPDVSLPTLLNRRFMVWYDSDGVEQVKAIATDAAIVSPTNPARLSEFLADMVPTSMVPLALEVLAKRAGRVMNQGKALSLQ